MSTTPIRIAVIGCGLIGAKRAAALRAGEAKLVVCVDRDTERARALAANHDGARVELDWCAAVDAPDVDALIVATIHDSLAPITLAAIRAGKHVLVEKPAARDVGELEPVVGEAEQRGAIVRVGFNHRFHPAFRKARELVDRGVLGELMMIRARYGHGGRLGYDREWRADRKLSGGGELIDQGMHLIDLSRWFLGEFKHVTGHAPTLYWDMPVEDNAFMLLRTATGRVAWLHASWSEWKNTFSLEIYGKVGKLHVEGLGGSYGTEKLTWYRMLPQMGPPEIETFEFAGPDESWALELAAFFDDIRAGRAANPGLRDALAALTIVRRVYEDGDAHHA